MKSKILIILSLFILSATHAANETVQTNEPHQHTFLVKTDLTKEQVEALLNQHHQNKNKNQAETTNLHKKSNATEEKTQFLVNETKPETTQLKAKKDKHAKKNKEVSEAPEVPEVPEVENKTEEETVNLKKKGKKEKKQEIPETPEAPEVPEVENKTEAETVSLKKKGKKEKNKKQEVPETPEVTEVPEVENKTEAETVSLKKKGKKEKNKKHEVPEVKEVENKTSLLANETSVEEVGEAETETEKVTLVNKDVPKQSGNKVFGFIFTILLTIAFVSLIIYATQPKKYKRQFNQNNSELTDYLLVKEN
jgi:chemotaxis protein histidine kinase CheA